MQDTLEFRRRIAALVAACVVLATTGGCGAGGSGGVGAQKDPGGVWQIQLYANGSHPLNANYDVLLYDVDMFETDAGTITALKAGGRQVICYFSTAYEEWRPDAADFTAVSNLVGNAMSGWPGERWVDIRKPELLTIMTARMDIAVSKGCDGIDPDNVHAYELGVAETGFALTAADQLTFNRALAAAAASRGLWIGLKNDISQAADLVGNFDFAINEQCYFYNECDALNPFTAAGKPVYHLEYAAKYVSPGPARDALCADSLARGHHTLIMPLKLDDSFRISCE